MRRLFLSAFFVAVTLFMAFAGPVENRGVYATNPQNAVGQEATITIDGDPSDWNTSMLIAQGSANDMCTAFKGSHENCVLDCYALYAAWDDASLYLAWQMVNTNDTWSREGDGPLSDGGRIGDVPLIVVLSIDPAATMTGRMTDGSMLWGKVDVVYETPVDRIFMMSGKAGQGTPAMFLAADEAGNTSYDAAYCKNFSSNGITYAMGETFLGNQLLYLNGPQAPADVYRAASTWINLCDPASWTGVVQKEHDTKYDSFYEMKIPFATLGIDKNYLLTNGIGAMMIATRGESGIDCVPHDPSMLNNVYGDYIHDASTSAEKSDSDTIRYQLANIGKIRAGSAAAPQAEAIVSVPDGYVFHAASLSVSIRLKNATSGSYSVNGGAAQAIDNMTTVSLGVDAAVGETVSLSVTAANAEGSHTEVYAYTKGDGFSLAPGTAIVVKPENWDEAYCYMYSGGDRQNAAWPGVEMNHLRDNFYYCSMPSGWASANVIFNNNREEGMGKEQYPAGNGLLLNAGEVKLWDWNQWYAVSTTTTDLQIISDSGAMKVFAIGNTLYINSDRVQMCPVFTVSGQLVHMAELVEGITEVYGLPAGVYLVNGQKIIIK